MKTDNTTLKAIEWFMGFNVSTRNELSDKYYPEYSEDKLDLEDEEITHIYLSEHPQEVSKESVSDVIANIPDDKITVDDDMAMMPSVSSTTSLEDAAKEYGGKTWHFDSGELYETCIKDFKAGAEWKEQSLSKEIEELNKAVKYAEKCAYESSTNATKYIAENTNLKAEIESLRASNKELLEASEQVISYLDSYDYWNRHYGIVHHMKTVKDAYKFLKEKKAILKQAIDNATQ